jgi:hypothetical protein
VPWHPCQRTRPERPSCRVSGGFGFGVDLVLAVPADEAAAIA